MPTLSKLLLLAAFFSVVGCSAPESYRLLPAPALESPVVNPPVQIRQKNWSVNGEGSCVHASLSSMLHWQNEFELAEKWRRTFGGGEYSNRLRQRLDQAGVPYAFTERSNLELLDFAHNTRRGALLWWKPSHCCTFCGWVRDQKGTVYAVILDNNRPQQYELVERSTFHKQWAGYGGFALTTLYDPPSSPIYKSFELASDLSPL